MKKIIFTLFFGLFSFLSFAQDTTVSKLNDTLLLQTIEVIAIRASDKAPFTKSNIDRQEIQEKNLGYDLPYILDQLPSVVAGSDAGNGVGYTNLRIRGSDATRINVTLNGIPFNDAESQGTFFVNMPDIASSVNSIQVQRGVGTSSNGPGSFGATINLTTNTVNEKSYAELSNTYGSFNTWKNTLKAGTGLVNGHFTFDGRFSRISSDGFIDRATSDLKSYYASAAWLAKKTSVRFNLISGKEKTYQAWNGVPEKLLKTDRRFNSAGMEKPGEPYKNETDNYHQSHYQLFVNQKVNTALSFNAAGFLVRGRGYYENYKAGQKFSKYGLPDVVDGTDVIRKTDLVLQRWLDNYFYGTIFSAQYARSGTNLIFGGGYSLYNGDHFNRVTWAQVGFPKDFSSYFLPAHKRDVNLYAKWMQSLGSGVTSFIDVQQRFVKYEINGFKDRPKIYIQKEYAFLNPKAGLSYFAGAFSAYASFSVGTKEPNRQDFEAGETEIPRPEILYDYEAGVAYKAPNFHAGTDFYFMDYKNQLVNTGKINDVGALTRTNAAKSYRAGIEMTALYKPARWIYISGNAAFSRNKIKNFTEYIYDENMHPVENHFSNTDISYSPPCIAGGTLSIEPVKGLKANFISKYVGSQFLDNTSDKGRMLPSYFIENAALSYQFSKAFFKEVRLVFQVNNLFDRKYEPNGYTYNYLYEGELYVENYYFPMAGINFMAGLNVAF